MLSGRYTLLPAHPDLELEEALQWCCSRLGVAHTGAEVLLHESEVVSAGVQVQNWPGIQRRGEVTEYSLLIASPHTCTPQGVSMSPAAAARDGCVDVSWTFGRSVPSNLLGRSTWATLRIWLGHWLNACESENSCDGQRCNYFL
eukprot:5215475-Amphidinium_carterae.2